MQTVAVIGATGAVGREIVRQLDVRELPVRELRLYASPRSRGERIAFRGEQIAVDVLTSLDGVDLAFFAAGGAISREWIPKAGSTLCIDSSSAFRMDPRVPLVIPEINAEALQQHHGVIASPNCAATILLLPLAPLHRRFGVKRVVVATYQAASGGGAALQRHLLDETRAALEGRTIPSALPFPYALNLFPHTSPLHESGYVEEELKLRDETRKILGDATIGISATCVRVPVLRAHSVAANVELRRPFALEEAVDEIRRAPGVTFFEERAKNRFATPHDATGQDAVFCGRVRLDMSQPNTLEFWAVGDQLLKGAALNAVQIAEKLVIAASEPKKNPCHFGPSMPAESLPRSAFSPRAL